MTGTVRSTPGPRRSWRAQTAIFEATIDLMAEVGFAGLSIEGIATRAGVGKTTIYRHWTSKAQLVIDAFRSAVVPVTVPDTGSLERDLAQAIEMIVSAITTPPVSCLLPSLVDAAERDPELAQLHREFSDERRQLVRMMFQRGIDRGEIPGSVNVEMLCDMVAGPVMYRRLVTHQPFPQMFHEDLARHVMAAARG